jgi:hypothetical protein
MMLLRPSLLIFLFGCIFFTAGCMQPLVTDNQTAADHPDAVPPSVAKFNMTILQPEDSASMVRMDTDIYTIGEVVEFTVTNDYPHDLSCSNDPPAFIVRYQKGSGQWVTRMGMDTPPPGNESILRPGESTATDRFVTTGWDPGRYRITSDCGPSHEILIRPVPSPTPTPAICPPVTNTTPWIRINPVSDQYAANHFTIAGTTSFPAGTTLQYSIFSLGTEAASPPVRLLSSSTDITGGTCGTSTWYVEGEIQVPGVYFIGISDPAGTVSAVKRFTILPAVPLQDAGTPVTSPSSPGITTG